MGTFLEVEKKFIITSVTTLVVPPNKATRSYLDGPTLDVVNVYYMLYLFYLN